MQKTLWLATFLIFGSVTLGELGRVPLLGANGILPNDLLIGVVVLFWLFQKTFGDRSWPKTKLWTPFLVFSGLAAISLLNANRNLAVSETLASGFYAIRFVEYFLWTLVIFDLAKNAPKTRSRLFAVLLLAALALSVLGFLQLKFFPDFKEFQAQGWDPHQNRLLSTWFDPNFLGGMLTFTLCLTGAHLLGKRGGTQKVTLGVITLILLVALFLTYSRSAYLALIISGLFLGILRSPKVLLAGLLAGLLLVSVSDRAYERLSDMAHSAKSLLATDTLELPDATARLRIESWQNAITLFKDHPWLGIGYNTYAYVQADYGFVKSLDQHSATGSDSTLLTILATTGIMGFMAYLWLLGTMLWETFRRRDEPMALGTFTGLLGLLVHSIFVNSLLFPPLLIFVYTAVGLSLGNPKKSLTKRA